MFSVTRSFSIPGLPTLTAPITNTSGLSCTPIVLTCSFKFTKGASFDVPIICTPRGRYSVTGFLITDARVAEPWADLTFNFVNSYAINAENAPNVLGTLICGLISIRTLV